MESKDFTEKEWQTLQFGPFWAFMAVAAQDGRIDVNEKEAFTVALGDTTFVSGALGKAVVTSVSSGLDGVFAAWQADDRSPADGFAAVRQVLAKVDADEANRYKGLLVWLAITVARASGSWHGGAITGHEERAIEEVAELLAFNVADAVRAATVPDALELLPR
jgi:hypothetical protein